MEGWGGNRWCKVKWESCQKNASNTQLTGWKFRCQPSSCRQSSKGEHLNSSDSASREQIKAYSPYSMFAMWTHTAVNMKVLSVLIAEYSNARYYHFFIFHFQWARRKIIFWKSTWSYLLINTLLWGLFVHKCWRHTAVKDCLVVINDIQSGCCAVASHHPGVSMEIIFISWNWYPLASSPSAFLCSSDLIKYTRWIWAGHVIRSWSCLCCLFLHCKRLLICSELWQ